MTGRVIRKRDGEPAGEASPMMNYPSREPGDDGAAPDGFPRGSITPLNRGTRTGGVMSQFLRNFSGGNQAPTYRAPSGSPASGARPRSAFRGSRALRPRAACRPPPSSGRAGRRAAARSARNSYLLFNPFRTGGGPSSSRPAFLGSSDPWRARSRSAGKPDALPVTRASRRCALRAPRSRRNKPFVMRLTSPECHVLKRSPAAPQLGQPVELGPQSSGFPCRSDRSSSPRQQLREYPTARSRYFLSMPRA